MMNHVNSKEEVGGEDEVEQCGKDAAILQELKEISNRHSPFNKSLGTRVSSSSMSPTNTLNCMGDKENALNNMGDDNELNDNQDCNDNTFLSQTNENRDLNQYWYSKHTIDTLCNAIREGLSFSSSSSSSSTGSNNARVAFLSTPSLFFSLSSKERQQCTLFDVSLQYDLLVCVSFEFQQRSLRRPKFIIQTPYSFPLLILFSLMKRGSLVQSIISMTTTTQRT